MSKPMTSKKPSPGKALFRHDGRPGVRPAAPSGGPHVSFPAGSAAETAAQSKAVSKGIALRTHKLFKSYRKGKIEVPVLRGVNLEIESGAFTAIIGQSGSGKSTLLHVLGTLDKPDSGEIIFDGARIDNLAAKYRDRFRNRELGMIFQFYHLLPELTTLENVLSPLMITHGIWGYWKRRREFADRAKALLKTVGLEHRLKHLPRELSGGEMQRTAIARALIAEPRLLLADEPTGNLDRKNGEEILRILRQLNEEKKVTIVMVTHDMAIAEQADRQLKLVEGVMERK
jgi:lipoprotein-releasing system ATP-binding protein